jgi:diacylglycerol kinase (ATP)
MTFPVADYPTTSREFPAIVFVNPLAGGARTGAYLLRVRDIFDKHQTPAEFVITESAEDLETRTRVAIAAGHRFLLAMGGDGTFQALANAAYGSDAVLGLLPAGGGNDFASALGLPGNPRAAAHAILHGGRIRAVDLLRARTADGRERLYAAGGGVGLDAEAMQYAAGAFRYLPGRLRYVASALRALYGFAPLHVSAEFPGSDLPPMESRVLLAGVLNTPTYGAGLRLAPDARLDDGELTTVFVNDLSALQVLTLLPRLLMRGALPDSHVRRTRAMRVRLDTDRPCFFHGDGEILGPAPVEVEVAHHAVRVLAPPRRA